MNNPWEGLPKTAPFVLKDDRGVIDELNAKFCEGGKEKSLIQSDILPVPYVGNPFTASVILLTLNPGFHVEDLEHYAKEEFRTACSDNMLHRPSDYPFYLLDPRFKETCGAKYWRKRLGKLIKEHGERAVAKAVCVIQWHPYHSAKSAGHPAKQFCQSQDYSRWLVEQAIERKCVVLLLRSRKQWESLVPATQRLPIANSLRGSYVTENNLSRQRGLWEKINSAIANHKE
jgi:hypothetical protein